MSIRSTDACLLCPSSALHLIEPTIHCFSSVPNLAAADSKIQSTVADILNKHFWFELQSERDVDAFVCQSCWLQVDSFHSFYQSVLQLYESRDWPPTKCKNSDFVPDTRELKPRPNDDIAADETEAVVESVVKIELHDESVEAVDSSRSSPADDELYRCHDCDKQYKSARRLAHHRATKHNAEKETDRAKSATADETSKQVVPIAVKRQQWAANEQLLQRHMQMECGECGERYTSFSAAKNHQLTQHDRKGYVKCCDRKFFKMDRALDHCRLHENPHQFDCPICGQSMQGVQSLAAHRARQHPAEPTTDRFACTQCDRQFRLAHDLLNHTRIVHTPPEQQKFECFDCRRRFVFACTLRSHMRTHDPQPSFVCDVCAQTFRSKAPYEQHVAQHAGLALKQQCPHCGRWMKHERQLKRHIQTLHSGKAPPAPCPECGHQAPNARALYAHRNKVHRPKRHRCPVCGREFRVTQLLREHMAIHAGITDLYRCAYCPKTFRSDANMCAHRKREHGEQYAADRQRAAAEEDERNRALLAEAAAKRI